MNLQKTKSSLSSAVILAALFTTVQFPAAQAATVGSNQCVQTVDSNSGVSVYQDSGSCFIAFKSATTYTWTPPSTLREIDLLVVGGGGGGGSRHAGGGGAGGLINSTSVAISGSDLSISIGSGGPGGAATGSAGNEGANGSNSQVSGSGITTRSAIGGGGGGYNLTSGSGGSSGGGGCCGQGLGTPTSGQGKTGSAGIYGGGGYVGGGGGGAGDTGGATTSSQAGNGGAGLAISWISSNAQSALSVGEVSSSEIFFAGGGGGSTNNTGTAGSGGKGGGKAGSSNTAAGTNATANTGGGGGGGGLNGGGASKGGDGGSGVVVIRYVIAVAQFDASNYTAGTTTWANSITGGTAGTTATGGMTKTASGPTGVVFAGKESSNSNQVSSSIGSTSSTDTVTVEMWMKLKDSGSAQNAAGSMLFSWGASGYNIYHYGNQLGYNTFASQLYGVDSTSYNAIWTHFVFVMTDTGDWSSQKIYVNGTLQASTCRVSPSACTNSQPRAFQSSGNFLLMNNANAANTWNAKVDLGQVKVYNGELSSTQISANYSSSSASYVEADSTPPTFSNGTTFSFAENTSASTVAATISVNESSTISIVSGVDSALFSISAVDTVTGQVKFLTSPDFESALDVGANNVYNITIRAADTLGNSADQAISITVTNVNESSTIGAPTLSGAASKGNVVTISITSTTAGKVRFFVSGKRIANCLARSTTGSYPSFSATCSWRPPVTGSQNLTARVTPTDNTFSATTSASTPVWVVKRISAR